MQESLNYHKLDPYVVVVPRVDHHTIYEVYIDDVKQDTYKFAKKSEEYSFKKIKINLKQGPIKIQKDLCWAMYPTHDGNYIPWKQDNLCDWFVGINCYADKWYYDPQVLEFYHIYLQGPSYFKGTLPIYNYKPVLPVDPKKRKENSLLLKKELNLCQ